MQTNEDLVKTPKTRNRKKVFASDIHIRLNENDFEKLKSYCKKNNKVISKVIRKTILDFLSDLENSEI